MDNLKSNNTMECSFFWFQYNVNEVRVMGKISFLCILAQVPALCPPYIQRLMYPQLLRELGRNYKGNLSRVAPGWKDSKDKDQTVSGTTHTPEGRMNDR
jgi:hypothetical protein